MEIIKYLFSKENLTQPITIIALIGMALLIILFSTIMISDNANKLFWLFMNNLVSSNKFIEGVAGMCFFGFNTMIGILWGYRSHKEDKEKCSHD